MVTSVSTKATIALTSVGVPVYGAIQQKETWEAMQTLGVLVTPDGNYWKEAHFLKEKADNYARRLLQSCLSKMDTYIFHCSTYTPSMTYSIGVTTLDKDKWNKIQQKSIPVILTKLGLNKNFPQRVAFCPKDLCGQSLLDMSVEQGVWKMMDFMTYAFARTSVSNMMLIKLRHLQLESGSGFHLSEALAMRIPFLTPCWMMAMQEFMAKNCMKFEVTKAKVLPLCREGDRYLMDDFRALQNLTDADLYDINRVRIFLKVTTLSNIADAAGLSITTEAFNALKLTNRFSPLKWP